jgi:ribosome-binding protein aMBF1 (putative translation factor)
MQTYRKLKAKYLSDPEVKMAYDDLEAEYQVIRKVIELRLRKKMSQKELADKIGTKQSAISRFENNLSNPTISFLSKIASTFNKKLVIDFK